MIQSFEGFIIVLAVFVLRGLFPIDKIVVHLQSKR